MQLSSGARHELLQRHVVSRPPYGARHWLRDVAGVTLSANTVEQNTLRVSNRFGKLRVGKIVGTAQSRQHRCAIDATRDLGLVLSSVLVVSLYRALYTTALREYRTTTASVDRSRRVGGKTYTAGSVNGANEGRGDHKRYGRTTSPKWWPAKVRYMQVPRSKVAITFE